jgi:hypothetical protein
MNTSWEDSWELSLWQPFSCHVLTKYLGFKDPSFVTGSQHLIKLLVSITFILHMFVSVSSLWQNNQVKQFKVGKFYFVSWLQRFSLLSLGSMFLDCGDTVNHSKRSQQRKATHIVAAREQREWERQEGSEDQIGLSNTYSQWPNSSN